MNFSYTLIGWYKINKRELPWRNTKNPYFIWLSEIILQQTKVEQGISYYYKFIKHFPTIQKLASADQELVLKLWQGLGYYSRARNLHASAKFIMKNYQGKFPDNYNEILNLKGVGTYTAAAVASFSFGLPYAVVDGNVIRLLSRIYGLNFPFESSIGKRYFIEIAQKLLDKSNPAENNQAIMEFGALQCTPKSPKCSICPFINDCIAFRTNAIDKFPIKSKKLKVKKRYLNYFLLKKGKQIFIGKRNNGIWKGLYDLPFIEFLSTRTQTEVLKSNEWNIFFKNINYKITSVSNLSVHKLSHQHLYSRFWTLEVNNFKLENFSFKKSSKISELPVTRLLDKFLKHNKIV